MKVSELQIQQNAYPLKTNHEIQQPLQNEHQSSEKQTTIDQTFANQLKTKIENRKSLQFSAHAQRRMMEREINLSPDKMARLKEGVDKIEEKGGRSSLILMDNTAYIVSVSNKTVVTTLAAQASTQNVFTNIDSVAIV